MTRALPAPSSAPSDPSEAFIAYLDFFRDAVRRRVVDLEEADLRTSRLPSGWSPVELLSHLVHMERRWIVWGFLGEQVDEPWGDQDDDEVWTTDLSLDELVERLEAGGRRTVQVVREHDLHERAASGGRFEGEPTATLLTILFHVLQEYARHTGHLDVARELIDGTTGED